MTRKLDTAFWSDLGDELRWSARRWWDDYRDLLIDMGQDEAEDIFLALKSGDSASAKMAVAARMTPTEWRKYRDSTTAQLRGIALRRALLLEALEKLGRRAMKVIGRMVMAALGL